MTALPPRIVADGDTQPFWDAAAAGSLVVQRCAACGVWIWQPRPLCPACHAAGVPWVPVSGNATIASWTALHAPVLEVWRDQVPFVVLLVELDDAPGVRMLGQLVDEAGVLVRTDGSEVTLGAPVALRWRTDEAGQRLPAWSLV